MRLIDADALIDTIKDDVLFIFATPDEIIEYITAAPTICPSTKTELLTDKEKRIFLAAMGREEKVCEEMNRKYPYGDSLMSICREIKRKVKRALW